MIKIGLAKVIFDFFYQCVKFVRGMVPGDLAVPRRNYDISSFCAVKVP